MSHKKTLAFILFSLSLMTQYPAQSQTIEEGKECGAVKDTAKRLLCYDLVFKTTQSNVPIIGKGSWDVSIDKSKLDDSKSVFLFLDSIDLHTDRYGSEKSLNIIIRCKENSTALYISFADQFMSDLNGGDIVTYRIDKQKAKKKTFSASNNSAFLGLWNGGRSIPFIKELISGKELYVVATPHSSSAVSGAFKIEGLREAIKPLREACSW